MVAKIRDNSIKSIRDLSYCVTTRAAR